MTNRCKIFLFLTLSGFLYPHGVREGTKLDLLSDCVREGAIHMITGYDHILFLIGVVFFLRSYLDIFKFITAFTVAHCVTLIFATLFEIRANAFLIDAVIAFSVIYKGFENLDGFKKWFSKKPPNLILMVFIFGLIHGFGLSTKLQEMATAHLSISQILSFNVGVEMGQVAALFIVFPLILIIPKESFKKISLLLNSGLIVLGMLLLIYQLNGYFTFEGHQTNEMHKDPIESGHREHHKAPHSHSHDHHDSEHSHDDHQHEHD